MIPRLVAALITIAVALCGLWAAENWGDERAPLLIDAAAPGCAPPVQLPNPCDSTNCNHVNTRLIA